MAQISSNTRGALFMIGSMAFFTMNDTAMKAVGTSLPMFQSLFIRALISVILMTMVVVWLGQHRQKIPRRDIGLIAARSTMDVVSVYFFFNALFNMPFANLAAILQILPLTVTLAGAIFLSEPIGWRRMVAILVGFVGVLFIVKPGAESFNVYSIYGLATVVVVTARDIFARKISSNVPSFIVALANAMAILLFAGLALPFTPWESVSLEQLGLIGLAACLIILAYFFSVATMRAGEISFVTPFRYSGLLFAILLGFIVFGELPDVWTVFGSVIVVATGLFTLLREARLKRRNRTIA